MIDYDFKSLSDYDFEILVRDLLNKQEKDLGSAVKYRSFKGGKDKGIDLIHTYTVKSPINEKKEIPKRNIVQIKHYAESSFSTLKSHLSKDTKTRKSEISKVRDQKPDKYIFVTSLKLSLHNKEQILDIFKPFIKTINDVYGKEDLNMLIGEYPSIEMKHFKLWLRSTQAIDRVLNWGIENRSRYDLLQIKKRFRLFVQSNVFYEAEETLHKSRVLILKGLPGVGKSTLAEILIFRLIADGYDLITVDRSLLEGEKVLRPSTKQVFYFDDFLGANYYEIISAHQNESSNLRFIRTVAQSNNTFLLLTTRTNILNEAALVSEKLNRNLKTISKYEVNLSSLNFTERRELLDNHLDYYQVPEEYCNGLDKAEIVEHQNFNPRLIEFISQENNWIRIPPSKYHSFIQYNLNNPSEVWEYAYFNQINNVQRFLLSTIFSLGNSVSFNVLDTAFESRLQYETLNNGYARNGTEFKNSLKKLENSFISLEQSPQHSISNLDPDISIVKFINPSIVDFLFHTLRDNTKELHDIINSIAFVEQLELRFNSKKKELLKVVSEKELDSILLSDDKLASLDYDPNNARLKQLSLILDYVNPEKSQPHLINLINKVELEQLAEDFDLPTMFDLLYKLSDYPVIKEHIKSRRNEIMISMINKVEFPEDLDKIHDIFDQYGWDFELFSALPDHLEDVNAAVQRCIEEYIEETLFFKDVKGWEDYDVLHTEISSQIKKKFSKYNTSIIDVSYMLNRIDWAHRIEIASKNNQLD